jgi:hypothetical protein
MIRSAIRAGVLATGMCVLLGAARAQVSMGSHYEDSKANGDEVEVVLSHGVWYEFGGRRIRAESVVIRLDRDEFRRLSETDREGLPRRGTFLPGARRTLSADLLAQRLAFFLKSMGSPRPGTAAHRDHMLLFRSVYMEGNVVIVDAGVEVLTAKSLLFSIPDNRVVLKGVVMRLTSKSQGGADRVLVLRAPKLVKQGTRTAGRGVSLTACNAGKPHFEVLSSEIEIIERGDEFEIFSRGNNLAFSGRRTVPLPNAHFFTTEQSNTPIKGARVRYSSNFGTEVGVDLGAGWNDTGGAIHHLLTGRPASEFRGEWLLGLGYVEKRGTLLEGELTYGVEGLYRGRTRGFFMGNDRGPNRSFIQLRNDGTVIDDSERGLIISENRVHLGENWRLDVTAFSASDEAVYPEYFLNEFQEAETPESSLHLRHAAANRLFTLTGRTNLATSSYADDRSLAPSFTNEAPLATYDVFSQPLTRLGETDIVLTSSTSAGVLEHEFDPRFRTPMPANMSDRTFRFDQDLELAAPFHLGPFAVRPRASGRFTYYDNTVRRAEDERWALDAGVSVTTRLARSFRSTDSDGKAQTIRHSIYPSVSIGHMYRVDGRPTDYYQFDQVDSLNENGTIRVGLLNRFQKTTGTSARPRYRDPFDPRERFRADASDEPVPASKTREFLFVDLAQNFFPIAGRDNGGETLGLTEYELIWRPHPEWIPVANLAFLAEGEHDWRNDRLRTFNAMTRFGEVLGCHWRAGYRTDYLVDGAVTYGVSRNLFGRWILQGDGAFDLQSDDQLYYAASLIRRDHDWVITMGLTFNIIQNDTTFRIDFEPLFGGLTRRRSNEFAGMAGRGSDAMLNY